MSTLDFMLPKEVEPMLEYLSRVLKLDYERAIYFAITCLFLDMMYGEKFNYDNQY